MRGTVFFITAHCPVKSHGTTGYPDSSSDFAAFSRSPLSPWYNILIVVSQMEYVLFISLDHKYVHCAVGRAYPKPPPPTPTLSHWIRKSKSKATANTQSYTVVGPKSIMLRVYFAPTDSPACILYYISPSCRSFLVPTSHRIELGRRYPVTRRGNLTSLAVSRGGNSN